MGTARSSLPLRLRQLLSGEGPIGPALKLAPETPPKIKAFIDKVIKSPLHDIAIPLSGFRWEYSKGNFHHWRPLFLHFDTYFKTHVSCREDLLLSDNISDDIDVFPKNSVLQILRVMQTILENCPNKSSFGGLEHFQLLLASTDPDIVLATLETLSALVKINPSKLNVSGKLIGCGSLNSHLLPLAQGWGSKEEGLGLFSCVMANEKSQEEGLCLFPSDVDNESDKSQYRLGSTLHFEFHVATQGANTSSDRSQSSNLCVIHIPELNLQGEDDLSILKHHISKHGVPPEHRFSLLTRIRYARAFRSSTCRQYTRICLLAFIVLVQSSDAHDELASFFANEPEYTNELIGLVRSEDAIPGTIRTLAMLALAAQLAAYSSSHERARVLSGSSIISASGNRMILLSVLQKAVSLLSNARDPTSLSFIDALLQFYLLHVISSSSSGSSMRGSGMVPTLLPLLQDTDSSHTHLICSAVKTLQKLMDYSNAAVSLFKDLGGVELLAQRLQIEVNRVIDIGCEDSDLMVVGDTLECDDDILCCQKRLIKALLKALGSATSAPANNARAQNSPDSSLPSSLSLIFRNVKVFGGDVYFSAVTVMSEIIHRDPTFFPILHDLGLPEAFLSSVTAGILPSSKALTCVPNGLGAICLNAKGLEAVKETNVLRFLVETFTSRKYLVAMNEAVFPLANAVEELLRHVSSLRSVGVEIIIEIIDKLSSIGDDVCAGPSNIIEGSTAMETDVDDKKENDQESVVIAKDSTADGTSDERFVQLCIFHVMVLVHRVIENSEVCRLFVEKTGIEALMKLLLRPGIAQSSEGMTIALRSTDVFKGFTQHHSAPLAQAFCSSLRVHLKKALNTFSLASDSVLLVPSSTPERGVFSSLFVVEFILFLAASKDNRWMNALLSEFGNGSKDVLEDIGRVHQEVLWQISLIDGLKHEMEDDCSASGSTSESQRSDGGTNETEEQRFNSFRQFLDPLMRRRVSGWSVESQFFDLLNIYRELGRATGVQQRLGMDGSLNQRLGSNHQPTRSNPADAGAVSRTGDKQSSYYASCSDMLRSLSFHISHLCVELGKAMLIPSRRRDDSVNVSPSSKSVASTIALIVQDHLNFRGHVDPNNMEASISTKCRYLGRVVNFIDSILLERPESCNPILINCFYGHGVVDSILTTFEATSQLLFAVNRPPASPMEMDDWSSKSVEKEETDHSWIYGALASYGTLMDHLVTSSFIFSPPTKHLLIQPVTNGNVPLPQDAEAFIKRLQSKVLKAVLPIWTHPQFTDCSYEFITAIISIVRHIYSGVEVKNASNIRAPITGPPPDESTISMIVEMGFSRPRAEEALRQVGANSVEMAMEWLCSHPEEVQEDDELARALAMSLGSSSTTEKEDVAVTANSLNEEDETVHLPPVEELLSTCTRLLQMKDSLAFPVRDLLVLISSQNDGQCRPKVITHIIDHVKVCGSVSDGSNDTMLSAFFHVLALILHDDAVAREVASKSGLVKIALDLLSQWNPVSVLCNRENSQVPKWATTSFLAIDRMLQVDPKLNPEILAAELLKKENLSSQVAVVVDENKTNNVQNSLGFSPYIDVHEQKRLIEIACRCIRNQVPSETMHVVLQLCATLTKVHSNALSFLDAGGLRSLLCLPTSCLFSGFENVAAMIVHHILEDPLTLQQAMESEIRYSVATNRHSSGRLSPRSFLQNMASVMSRDPLIFMKAAQSVCEIEMVGERPHVVLLKDREKEKSKEKEKDKQQSGDGKATSGDMCNGKLQDSNTKNAKGHRKFPQSFISTIELLLEYIVAFAPSLRDDGLIDGALDTPSLADMEVDGVTSKGKGKAIATVSQERKPDDEEVSASLGKAVFILKLLTESLLMYASSIHILLRRDAEDSNARVLPQRGPPDNCSGGIFHHVLHKFLPYSGRYKKDKKAEGDLRQKLVSRASQFLVASSIRSAEGRRRVFTEISNVFIDFVDSADGVRAPNYHIHSYVDLLNDIFATRSPTGSSILADTSATFIDVGLVRSLTRTLKVLDLDHADSPKVVTGIIKVLELVTKEHVHSTDLNAAKASTKPSYDHDQSGRADNDGNRFQSLETTSQPDRNEVGPDHIEHFSATQTSGSSDSGTDAMEHDGDSPGREDDYMHELSEEAGGLEDRVATVEIRFDIPHDGQDNLVDEDNDDEDDEDDEEDDEMSGDDVDEDEEDDEENNDLEEDEVHDMSHPDMDQEEHEIDEDEFDEDGLEEEDDGDEDDEDGVILQLEEGINGIDVLDQIEVFSRDYNFVNDTFRVMPVDVFGSRRQGRTTSIYNLIGRNGDHGAPPQHPLLVEPSSSQHAVTSRQSENAGDMGFFERNLESASSRLDGIFRALRSGRHGQRLNMWADDGQQRGGSNGSAIPPGIEELLISQLRRPAPDQPSEQNVTALQPQDKGEASQLQESGAAGSGEETQVVNNESNGGEIIPSPSPVVMDVTCNADVRPEDDDLQARDGSNADMPAINMQYDHSDAVVRDVEAVSQESSGSGATLGESLRSLEVEIGSVDGHDDGGERQGPTERPSGDLHPSRMRRGNTTLMNSRDTSLQSVSEVSPLPPQEDQSGATEQQQINQAGDSGSIDPAFLDALPEELRVEVLSTQQSQATQLSNDQPQYAEDIDPEFLAALPPDIRAEVLAQQQAQRINQSHELEGQPVEMDTVSIIATFPSDLREEVLLTSSDAILANLTPALVAEANMLRERYAHRYHSRGLLGMYPRNRRGDSSRRGEAVGSSLDRIAGNGASRKSVGGKLVEADGAPLVDGDALKAMIRLFRVVQPLYKGQFQKLLLNLCAHHETRTSLMQILMDMLMLDVRGPVKDLNGAEPSYRLYSCQSYVMYSRPQFTDGIPPLLSRRILETMTYLARNHPNVAKLLLHLELPRVSVWEPSRPDQARGKAVMVIDEEETETKQQQRGDYSIVLLLSLLNQPLYFRSISHLEQLLRLLEVIIDNAESASKQSNKSDGIPSDQPSGSESAIPDANANTDTVGSSDGDAKPLKADDDSGPSVSGVSSECDTLSVLLSLPQPELRLLCSLLARDGLSDSAYVLVAEVLKRLVAIAPAHRHLFITELADSVQSLTKSALNELHGYMEVEKALSTTSTDGTAILRVLQALSSLVASSLEKDKDPQVLPEKEYNDALSQVWDINATLEPLWMELSACISKIESCPDSTSDLSSMSVSVASSSGIMAPLLPGTRSVESSSGIMAPLPAGTQNILPYIEAFFVTCEKLRPGQSTSAHEFGMTSTEVEEATTSTGTQKSSVGNMKADDKHIAFAKFSEKHRKLLNSFIRQNPGLLEKSLSLMLKVPRFIDFDNKRAYFRSKIKHQHDHHSPLRISVRRAYILEDSYNQLRMRSTQDLKGRLNVHFQGEEGIDAGGLTREWYQLLSRVIFDKGALLFTTVGNESTFQPNPNSVYQTEHLSYFKFVGRVVGKALFDGQLLDVHFTRSFYKHILGVKVTYHDIEAIDPGYFRNLKWMLENDTTDVLDLPFSMDADEEKLILYERTQVTDYELIPGGRNIKVTEENKHEYVDLVTEHRLTTAIRPQINAFMEGFNEMILRDLISIFNDKELELLISGLPEIDLDDLRANTEYSGYSAASPVIQWFWDVVQGFSKEDKARLLQFVTGTSKVPLEGFSALQGISGSQRFQIHKAYGSPNHLPSAHTCFNQLDLPEYPSKQQLQERLLLAIHEANEGFGFG